MNADHGGVCKFDKSKQDQDNFKPVRFNIKDLYKKALKIGELTAISSAVGETPRAEQDRDKGFEDRFAKLKEGHR